MNQHEAVLAVVDAYCRGVYHGDVDLLRTVFDPRAQLFAEIRGEAYFRPLTTTWRSSQAASRPQRSASLS